MMKPETCPGCGAPFEDQCSYCGRKPEVQVHLAVHPDAKRLIRKHVDEMMRRDPKMLTYVPFERLLA